MARTVAVVGSLPIDGRRSVGVTEALALAAKHRTKWVRTSLSRGSSSWCVKRYPDHEWRVRGQALYVRKP